MSIPLFISLLMVFIGTIHHFWYNSQIGVFILCFGLFCAPLCTIATSNVKCDKCKIQYNNLGNTHCCACKKVYTNAICDMYGNITIYSHCCICNEEYNDDYGNHTCFK